VPALGESNCLILRSSDGTLAGLADLDEGAVDKAELPFWFTSQVSQSFGPEASLQPPPMGAHNGRSCSNVPNEKEVPATEIPPAGGEGLPGVHVQRRTEAFQYSVFSPFSINLFGPISVDFFRQRKIGSARASVNLFGFVVRLRYLSLVGSQQQIINKHALATHRRIILYYLAENLVK
jgi:hypothetical protein